MKSQITDKTLGIISNDKFAEVRQRATDEYTQRAKRKKKDKTIKLPKHKIGEQIVLTHGIFSKHYLLIEVIDFDISNQGETSYYGIILKATLDKERIGRLIKTDDWGYYRFPRIEKIPVDSIKWSHE